jgi:uncharacterized protein YkwD
LRKLNSLFGEAFQVRLIPAGPPRRPVRRSFLLEELETRQLLSGYQPTGVEQQFLERLNDARANPAAYGQSIGLDLSGVAPSQPLAFNTALIQSSRDHSTDMSVNNYFDHTGSDGSSPFQRMSAAGYPWVGAWESIAAGPSSPEATLRVLIVDAGIPDQGHRCQLLSIGPPYSSEQEIGVGIVLNGSGSYRNYYTIDSGNTADANPFLTGVAYNDLNNNGVYDNGEGLAGVTVNATGPGGTYQTTTWGSGGYSLRVQPGTYTVTVSGGGLATRTQTVTVGAQNYRFNILANQTPPAAPTGLVATGGPRQVSLSWADVSGETGYKVERSLDGVNGWAQIGTTGVNVTTYQDTGLNAGTTYYYRVRATNASGDGAYSPVASASTAAGSALFADSFRTPALNAAWRFVGGSWRLSGGALAQTSTANTDPRKALVTGQTFPADVAIAARVRVDSWANGNGGRAGVGLYTDPTTGRGYNLVFHNNTNTVQFLNDGVAWGNSYAFAWQVGLWYWFKLQDKGGVLYGKVWADGSPEPAAWMFQQTGWTGRSSGGAPALNGGSSSAGSSGNATASFDDVSVTNAV